jgi:hypothetical protein
MSIRLEQLKIPNDDADAIDMTTSQIYGSIFCAILHLIFILIEVKGEASSLNIDLPTYMFMCLNGRVNFVPYCANMRSEKFREEEMILTKDGLQLDNIYGTVCCF